MGADVLRRVARLWLIYPTEKPSPGTMTLGSASQKAQPMHGLSIGTVLVFLNARPARGSRPVTQFQSWRTETSGRWAGFS